jgi:hypothetical protein
LLADGSGRHSPAPACRFGGPEPSLLSWDREELDFRVRKGGYWGGMLGLVALGIDYAVS